MKALFIGTYSCLGIVGALVGVATVLSLALTAVNLAWGVVGILFLAIAATCLWLVCGCGREGPEQHA